MKCSREPPDWTFRLRSFGWPPGPCNLLRELASCAPQPACRQWRADCNGSFARWTKPQACQWGRASNLLRKGERWIKMNSQNSRHSLVATIVAILLAWPVICRADSKDETYRERLEYNPATGEWVELLSASSRYIRGRLGIARERLAKGEYKKARKPSPTGSDLSRIGAPPRGALLRRRRRKYPPSMKPTIRRFNAGYKYLQNYCRAVRL